MSKKEEHPDGYCHFCCIRLKGSEYNDTWVEHGDTAACLRHKGIKEWHAEQCRKEHHNHNGENST